MRLDAASGDCLVVIDPQRGFSEADGTLGLIHGASELIPIQDALGAVSEVLRTRPEGVPSVLVRSEYRYGQFGRGALARLCVPGMSTDCELAPALASSPFDARFIKSEQDACTNPAFLDWVADHRAHHPEARWILTGLLLQHCVAVTALGLRRRFGRALPIVVPPHLCGSRESSGRARQEALAALQHAHVETPTTFP